jgi:hypothetical protein
MVLGVQAEAERVVKEHQVAHSMAVQAMRTQVVAVELEI